MTPKEEKRSRLTEHSWISLSLAFVLVGGAFWATLVYAQVGQSKDDIAKLEAKQMEYDRQLSEINQKLATIQGMLMRNGQ